MIGAVALQVLDVLLVEDDLFIDAIRKVDNFYYADGSAGKLRTRGRRGGGGTGWQQSSPPS